MLIRPGAIGDFLVHLPAMEALQADYTEVWCASACVPLVRFANRAISIASSGLDRLGILNDADVVERLRGFDEIVSWYGSNRPEFRELVASLGLPFRFLPAFDGRAPGIPKLAVPRTERTFAVVHPFASSPAKRAPMLWFQAMADRLAARMPVYWLAGPEESLPEQSLNNAIRIENLYELACWLAGARVYVGNDSGISHLAASVGTPVLAAFVSTDSRVWAPRGFSWVAQK